MSWFQALVLFNLDYASALLFGLPNELLEHLEKIQRSAARLVVGAKKNDRITYHMKALHWLPLRQRIVFKLMVLTYRCLNGTAPRYLSSLVSRYYPRRSLRSASSGKLDVTEIKLDRYGGRSFSRPTPVLWKELPLSRIDICYGPEIFLNKPENSFVTCSLSLLKNLYLCWRLYL